MMKLRNSAQYFNSIPVKILKDKYEVQTDSVKYF